MFAVHNINPINSFQSNSTFLKQHQHLWNAYTEQHKTISDSFSKILYDIEFENDK